MRYAHVVCLSVSLSVCCPTNEPLPLQSNQQPTAHTHSFGPNFLVELEVVLPPDMPVRESHDIALALQQKVRFVSF